MCKIEFGFSNFRKLGFVKKGHVVSVAVLEEHRGKSIGKALMIEGINGAMYRKADDILRGKNQQYKRNQDVSEIAF